MAACPTIGIEPKKGDFRMTLLLRARRMLFLLLTIAVMAFLVVGVACGGDDDDDDGGDDGGEATEPAGGDDDDGGGAEEFAVTMTDNKFAPGDFTVPAGSSVTFNLTNDGAAIHNMRIAGDDGEYNSDDDAVSDPDLVNGGDTAVLEWTAPEEAGEVDFQCDFHPTDMLGTITVE
jgi:plastocyanin